LKEFHIKETRLARFREAYLANGFNAVRAAIAIGMKPKTAKANAHRLARHEATDAGGAVRDRP
jgi:phage terminase small subunit